MLGPGLPPSVLPGAFNRNRMVVKCWRSTIASSTPWLLNSAKDVRTPPQRDLGLFGGGGGGEGEYLLSYLCCFEKT